MAHIISPSLLAANFGNLENDIKLINESVADWLHLDIMDGVFVPNISFGFPVVDYANSISTKPLDVHLMIVEPERYLSRFRDSGAALLTVHAEACRNLNRTVQEIRELGMKAGVSLNPHTPVSDLKYILPFVDLVLIMSVNPGYGGQKFIPNSYDKIRELKQMITAEGYDIIIEVDGGVNRSNAEALYNSGVDALVAGSSVFGSEDPRATIKWLKELA